MGEGDGLVPQEGYNWMGRRVEGLGEDAANGLDRRWESEGRNLLQIQPPNPLFFLPHEIPRSPWVGVRL